MSLPLKWRPVARREFETLLIGRTGMRMKSSAQGIDE